MFARDALARPVQNRCMGILDRVGYRGPLRQHKCTSRLDRQWRVCRIAFWVIVASFVSLLAAGLLQRL